MPGPKNCIKQNITGHSIATSSFFILKSSSAVSDVRRPIPQEHAISSHQAASQRTPGRSSSSECWPDTRSNRRGDARAESNDPVVFETSKSGVAKAIKKKIFNLSREKYPDAKLFGLTTGLAVMKINSELGYEPVTYSELTQDEAFWAGCKSCVNYEILMSKERKNCMCTAMLYDPKDHYKPEETKEFFEENKSGLERLLRFKKWKFLKPFMKKDNGNSNESKPKSFLQLFFNI